jgi:hypothetical protein
MSNPSHRQYAIVTYLIILLMILFAVGMMTLVAYNA